MVGSKFFIRRWCTTFLRLYTALHQYCNIDTHNVMDTRDTTRTSHILHRINCETVFDLTRITRKTCCQQ